MPSTLPSSIPDSQLGLSASELAILRQHQQIALSSTGSSSNHYAQSTASSRGRGHARSSASTSRAASAASSQGHGRLMLDPGSLAVLGSHFERLMGAIQNRVDSVCFSLFLPRQIKEQPCIYFFPSLSLIRSTSDPPHSSQLRPNAPSPINPPAPPPPSPPPTQKSPVSER